MPSIVSSGTALLLLVVAVSYALEDPWIVTLQQRRNSSDQILTEKQCRGVVIDSIRVLTVGSCARVGCSETELIVAGSCTEPDRKVVNVTMHPAADVAILFVDYPFPINESSISFPNLGRKSPNVASLDTASGLQEVPIVEDDPCTKTSEKTFQSQLFIASQCDTYLGSPLLGQKNGTESVLIGLVSSIPPECHNTSCRIHLTDVSHYQEWLAEQSTDESNPSIKLPKIPATVVFSFLKLLAVVSSLGGISFAFCCVMFLISN